MKTVLVIDDMAIFREPIEAILRAENLNVLTAADGAQALDALAAQPPDLVLLDLGLPVVPGMVVLQHMRSHPRYMRTPVIVLSAENDRVRIVDAVKLGISGYLLKSAFSLKAMLERVKAVLEGSDGSVTGSAKTSAGVPDDQGQTSRSRTDSVGQDSLTTATRSQARSVADHTPAVEGQSGRGSTNTSVRLAVDDLDRMRPIVSKSELLDKLSGMGELKGFSPTVSQIINLVSSPNCSAEQIAKAVSQDHGMALKILRIANSSAYSRGDRVDTVQKAVLRIGLEQIRHTAMSIGVMDRFGAVVLGDHFNAHMFWEHSIACGVIAAGIARTLKHPDPEVAFTAGLLHDLGRVILAELLGDDYARVLSTASELAMPVEQIETRLLALDHAQVMDRLLRAWRFPKELVNPVVLHHANPSEVRSAGAQQIPEILRLGLANRLAHALLLGSSGNDTVYPTEAHCRALDLDGEAIRRITDSARQQTDEMKIALLMRSKGEEWPGRVDYYRQALSNCSFRPLYVSASSDVDAYRILCEELGETQTGQPPSMAVVHIHSAKDREGIAQRLVLQEQEAGVQRLPVLMLLAAERLALHGDVLAGRKSQVLITPVPVSQLIAAIKFAMSCDATQRAA